jgi:hypothetical protein
MTRVKLIPLQQKNFRRCGFQCEIEAIAVYACLSNEFDAVEISFALEEAHAIGRSLGRDFVIGGTLYKTLAETQRTALNIPLYQGEYQLEPHRQCEIYASHYQGYTQRFLTTWLRELPKRYRRRLGTRRATCRSSMPQ